MARGHLKTIVLSSLEKKPMSGSEIIDKLKTDLDWKPSCGSIYPILAQIQTENLAIVKTVEGSIHKKLYYITKKGKLELKKRNKVKKELVGSIVKIHKMMNSVYGVDDKIGAQFLKRMKSDMNTNKAPFYSLHKESEALKLQLFRLYSENLVEDNKDKIKRILISATKELEKIKSEQGILEKKTNSKKIIKK